MATNKINTRIVIKNDTYENWVANNPTLLKGEVGIVTGAAASSGFNTGDTTYIVIGDGVSAFKDLSPIYKETIDELSAEAAKVVFKKVKVVDKVTDIDALSTNAKVGEVYGIYGSDDKYMIIKAGTTPTYVKLDDWVYLATKVGEELNAYKTATDARLDAIESSDVLLSTDDYYWGFDSSKGQKLIQKKVGASNPLFEVNDGAITVRSTDDNIDPTINNQIAYDRIVVTGSSGTISIGDNLSSRNGIAIGSSGISLGVDATIDKHGILIQNEESEITLGIYETPNVSISKNGFSSHKGSGGYTSLTESGLYVKGPTEDKNYDFIRVNYEGILIKDTKGKGIEISGSSGLVFNTSSSTSTNIALPVSGKGNFIFPETTDGEGLGENGYYVFATTNDVKNTKEDLESQIKQQVASVFRFKGTVTDLTALEAIDSPVIGDVYHVTANHTEYVYATVDGEATASWEELGSAELYTVKSDFEAAVKRLDEKDTQLQSNIDAEKTRALGQENAIKADLAAETNRAITAEKTLTDNLAAEVTRATDKENSIASDLATEVADRTAAITAEKEARVAADDTLSARVAALEAAVTPVDGTTIVRDETTKIISVGVITNDNIADGTIAEAKLDEDLVNKINRTTDTDDSLTLDADGKLTVNEVSTDKIVQGTNTFVMDGGTSNI